MSIPILHAVQTINKKVSNGDNVISASFTVDNVADRVLEIDVSMNQAAPGSVSVLSAFFGGQAIAAVSALFGGDSRLQVRGLISPNVGTDTISVTVTDPPGGTTRACVVGIKLYKNANQVDPFVTSRAQSATADAGDASLTVSSMDEELVSVSVAAQEDKPLNPVSGQTERWDATQVGDAAAETMRSRGATKVGEASTVVGWTGEGSGNRNYAVYGIPIIGPGVSMQGLGQTSNQATSEMSRIVPLDIDATGQAIVSALVTAANWLLVDATGQAKATVTLTESTFLQALATGQAIAGARVETGPRLFVINSKMVIIPLEVNIAASADRVDGVTFQATENGLILRITVKNAGAVVDLTGGTVLLYVSGHGFNPFPLSITNPAAGVAEYIVGGDDFVASIYQGQIDILLPSANQYRSAAFPFTVIAAVA